MHRSEEDQASQAMPRASQSPTVRQEPEEGSTKQGLLALAIIIGFFYLADKWVTPNGWLTK